MATKELTNPTFQDPDKAREWLEAHLWANGRACPFCGTVDRSTAITGRTGLYQCNEPTCRKQFTVMVGTLFERSHIALNKWLMAAFLLSSSKKGISTHQMHRMIGVSYKSTWFMMHRLREAAREGFFSEPLGGAGKFVEADETYIGGSERNKHRSKRTRPGKSVAGSVGKEAAVALVERGGSVRSFHLDYVNAHNVRQILVSQVKRGSYLMTDDSGLYKRVGREFAGHETVYHTAGEYVRGNAHTNTIENYFSILKRGITGTYHHVSQQHLKRYLAEFDFRYNERSALGTNDKDRAAKLLTGIVGKRLTYRRTGERQDEQTPF